MIKDISQTEPNRQISSIGPYNPLKQINQIINQDDSSFKDLTINNYDQIFPNNNNHQLISPTNNSKIHDKDNQFLIDQSHVVPISPNKLETNKLIKIQPISSNKLQNEANTLNPLFEKFRHIFESYEQQSELQIQIFQYYQFFGFLITIILLIYPTLSITLDIFTATIPLIGIKSLEIILNLHLIKQIGKLFQICDMLSFVMFILILTHIPYQHIYLILMLVINLYKFQLYSTLYQKQYSLYQKSHQLFILLLKLILILHNLIYFSHISVYQNLDYDHQPYITHMLLVLNILSFNSNFIPQDQTETIYLIFMIFLSIILHFYVLLKLINIYRIDDRQIQLKQYLIQNTKLDHHLRTFLENQFQKPDLTDIIKNNSMLDTINRSQIYNILKTYFHHYNNKTLHELVDSCIQLHTAPNDIIIKQNDNLDKSIYFIIEGEFAISTSYGQQIGLSDPQFGEYSFYTDQLRQASIVSLGYGHLLKLDRQVFLQRLNESDKQHFHQIKDKIVYESLHPYKCLCCKMKTHSVVKCPVLTFQPKISVLNQNSKNKQIYRIKYNRRKQEKSKNAFKVCQPIFNKQQRDNHSESSSSLSSYDFNQLPYDEEYNSSQLSNFDSPLKQQIQEQQEQEQKAYTLSHNLYKYQMSPIKSKTLDNNNVQRDQRRTQSYNKTSILNVINEQVEDQYQSESERSSEQTNRELDKFSLNPQQGQMAPRHIISEYVEQTKQFQSQSQSEQFTSYDHLENIDIYNQDFEIVEDFDKMQNYKIYNPHNNYYNSIQNSNSLIDSYNPIQMNIKKYLESKNERSLKIN